MRRCRGSHSPLTRRPEALVSAILSERGRCGAPTQGTRSSCGDRKDPGFFQHDRWENLKPENLTMRIFRQIEPPRLTASLAMHPAELRVASEVALIVRPMPKVRATIGGNVLHHSENRGVDVAHRGVAVCHDASLGGKGYPENGCVFALDSSATRKRARLTSAVKPCSCPIFHRLYAFHPSAASASLYDRVPLSDPAGMIGASAPRGSGDADIGEDGAPLLC